MRAEQAILTRFCASRCDRLLRAGHFSGEEGDEDRAALWLDCVARVCATLRAVDAILKHYACGRSSLVCALCLLDRVDEQDADSPLLKCPQAICETFLACFAIAMKCCEDTPLKLAHLAKTSRVELGLLASLESQVLWGLEFQVVVTEPDFLECSAIVGSVRHALAEAPNVCTTQETLPFRLTVIEAADAILDQQQQQQQQLLEPRPNGPKVGVNGQPQPAVQQAPRQRATIFRRARQVATTLKGAAALHNLVRPLHRRASST